MKPKIINLALAIKLSGVKSPTEIVVDGTRHKFVSGKGEEVSNG